MCAWIRTTHSSKTIFAIIYVDINVSTAFLIPYAKFQCKARKEKNAFLVYLYFLCDL